VIPAALSKVFFDGKQAGSVMTAESGENGTFIAYPRWLAGGYSAFTLSPRGCREYGFPKERCETPRAAALDLAIGTLHYCTLSDARRYLVEHDEVVALLGTQAPASNVTHIWTDERGGPQLLRVYQTLQSPSQTIKRIHSIVAGIKERTVLTLWARSRLYGLAVLVPSRSQLPTYRRAVERAGIDKYLPIYVDLGPTAETLASELRRKRN
jgi:hypothetical protein